MNRPSYYDILGLPTFANKEEIKSAYRQLAQKYHPDKQSPIQIDGTLFIIINNAYRILANELKKSEYDAYLKRIKNKDYSPIRIFKANNSIIEKALVEFNYTLWDIEDIIRKITEEDFRTNIDGKTLYNCILNLFRSIEEEILNENDRYTNFIHKQIAKRHIETYFYLLRIEIQKHIENISSKNTKIEIKRLMKAKSTTISVASDMNNLLERIK